MKVLTVIAAMSLVVTAVYVLRGLGKVFYGPIRNSHFEKLTDATVSERIATGLLAAVLIVLGLFPWFFINMIESSLMPLINRLHETGAVALWH